MRVLAVFCGAFSAGIFLAQYLLPVNWLLPGAWSAFAAACLGFLIPGTLPPAYPEKRALLPGNAGKYLLLTGTGLAFALGWNWLYVQRTAAPAAALSGVEQTVEMSIQDYPASIPYGIRATVKMDGIPGLAAWYGGWEYAGLQPGQVIQDTVRFQDAGHIREDDVTAFTSRGIFLLSYGQKNTRLLGEGTAASLRWLPLRTGKAVQEKIHELLQGDQAAFLSALLTADRSDLSVQAASDLEEAGLTHVLAVSGMHCGFLLAVLAFVVGRHRRHLLALIAVLVLIFFAFLTGGRPSVVRACIMLFFLLAAPLFNRESDAPTALMAALFLILLHNPFAAESVSLQLSFASVFGLLWLTPKLYRGLLNWLTAIPPFRWEKPSSPLPASASPGHAASHGLYRFRGALFRFLAASVSASLGALAFTAPLSGYYFGVLPVAAPLSGVLCLWAVGAAFVTGLAAVGIGFVCPPLGPIAALVPGLFIRYILFMAHAMVRLPGHALYFANPLLKYWLAFAYLLPAAAYFVKMPLRRKVVWTAMLLALSLAGTVLLYRGQYQHDLDAVELDVGQGQCILLASGGRYALADCGSGSSWYDAGALAARKLRSLGCRQLDMLLLTHFDADHINGAEALLARLPVRELLIPTVPESESAGARDTVVSLAKRYGADVRTVTEREVLPFGLGMLTVFPPVDSSGDNDSGLSLLASAGEADFLITGDMGQAAERKLLSAYDLPDLEAFAAGHHGSKYSTSETLLDTLTPETVCVSVGSNSYGHPAPETLDRLEARGITVYRTDRDGDIHLALDR
ncbi:MAG: ComEC/Rec2 family competence protein [Oscillibacter sp.]|nr:ComEC/Rec2 family competence protein [Oscillibacter sp.]